jgi:excisionase family DNA binding protein
MDNKFINAEQACELLNLSKSTLYKMTSTNKIPFYKCGRRLLFVSDELFKYVINLNSPKKKDIIDNIKEEDDDDDSFLIPVLAA